MAAAMVWVNNLSTAARQFACCRVQQQQHSLIHVLLTRLEAPGLAGILLLSADLVCPLGLLTWRRHRQGSVVLAGDPFAAKSPAIRPLRSQGG